MFVKEIMSSCVAECTEDTALEEVYELLKKCEHGLVVVIDSHAHRVPIGIVSERSICDQIIVRGKSAKNTSAGAVIDSHIRTVREDDLVESIDLLEVAATAAIVVTNVDRHLSGILSMNDLRRARAVNNMPASSGQVSEIPAFGWVQ